MYHSLTFYDGTSRFNTYSTWGLVPETRPSVVPPEPKTKVLDIPSGDGVIDLSESLSGKPVFNNREGEWTFYVLNDYVGSEAPAETIVSIVDTPDSHGGIIRSITVGAASQSSEALDPDRFSNWSDRLQNIMASIQGKRIKVVLDDDPSYYYIGRFYVSDWDSSNDTYSMITISYNVDPHKKGFELGSTGNAIYLVDTGESAL